MAPIDPDLDRDLRVPDLPGRGNRMTRLIAIAIALVVLLALLSQLFPGALTGPGPSPVTPPPPPATTAP